MRQKPATRNFSGQPNCKNVYLTHRYGEGVGEVALPKGKKYLLAGRSTLGYTLHRTAKGKKKKKREKKKNQDTSRLPVPYLGELSLGTQ